MNDINLNEKLSAYRKNRSLLTKAYRSARRAGNNAYRSSRNGGSASDHYLKALDIFNKGASMGIKVGGINSYSQTQANARSAVNQDISNAEAINRRYFQKPNQVVAAPVVPEASYSEPKPGHIPYDAPDPYTGDVPFAPITQEDTADPVKKSDRLNLLNRFSNIA